MFNFKMSLAGKIQKLPEKLRRYAPTEGNKEKKEERERKERKSKKVREKERRREKKRIREK